MVIGVVLYDEFFVWVIVSKDWSLGDKVFYFIEGFFFVIILMLFDICLG